MEQLMHVTSPVFSPASIRRSRLNWVRSRVCFAFACKENAKTISTRQESRGNRAIFHLPSFGIPLETRPTNYDRTASTQRRLCCPGRLPVVNAQNLRHTALDASNFACSPGFLYNESSFLKPRRSFHGCFV